MIVLDTLPIPGDIGLKDLAPRLSGWQPFFAGQFTANPPAATVQYTTTHNPCRVDLNVNPPGCETPTWGPLPADLSSVGAIKVDFGSLVLNPNDAITFSWSMAVPADAPLNSIAWNSFGYIATRTDNLSLLESAEPQKVGLQVIPPNQPPCTTPPCTPPPPSPPLPPTGSDANVLAIVAVILTTGGLALLAISRRPSARAAAG